VLRLHSGAWLGRVDADPFASATLTMKCFSCRCVNEVGARAGFRGGLRLYWTSRLRCSDVVKSYVSGGLQSWVDGNHGASNAGGADALSENPTRSRFAWWGAGLSKRAVEFYERVHEVSLSRSYIAQVVDLCLGPLCARLGVTFWRALGRIGSGWHERDHVARRTLVTQEVSQNRVGTCFWGSMERSSGCGAPLPLGFSSYWFGCGLARIAEPGRSGNDFSRRSLEIGQRIYYGLKECGNRFCRRLREVVQ